MSFVGVHVSELCLGWLCMPWRVCTIKIQLNIIQDIEKATDLIDAELQQQAVRKRALLDKLGAGATGSTKAPTTQS